MYLYGMEIGCIYVLESEFSSDGYHREWYWNGSEFLLVNNDKNYEDVSQAVLHTESLVLVSSPRSSYGMGK